MSRAVCHAGGVARTNESGARPRVETSGVLGTSSRLYIRTPRESDADTYLELRRASQEFHAPWEPIPPPGFDPFSAAAFDRFLSSARGPSVERMLVFLRDDARLVGCFNLSQIARGPFQSAVLGYWVGAPHQRRGYMGEALPMVLDHAFGRLGLHRVEANIRPENAASIALARRTGFRYEGYSPRYLQIAGSWCDHERWTMLAEDWAARARGERTD